MEYLKGYGTIKSLGTTALDVNLFHLGEGWRRVRFGPPSPLRLWGKNYSLFWNKPIDFLNKIKSAARPLLFPIRLEKLEIIYIKYYTFL